MPQALYLRFTAPRFAAPQNNRHGLFNAHPEHQDNQHQVLVAIGDSIIAGVGVEQFDNALVGQTAYALSDKQQCPISYHSFGKLGVNSKQIIEQLLPKVESLVTEQALAVDYIVVSTGVNDATSLMTLNNYRDNLGQIIERLHKACPNAKIVLAGFPSLADFPLLPNPLAWVFGIRSTWLHACAQQAADNHEFVHYLPVTFSLNPQDFADDGYHPNAESYRVFGEAVAEALLQNE